MHIRAKEDRFNLDDRGIGIDTATYEGDKFKLLHVQNIEPILKSAHLQRQSDNNGWTDGKRFRKIATIPSLEIVKHPELMSGDAKVMRKYLMSDEGSKFRTVRGGI